MTLNHLEQCKKEYKELLDCYKFHCLFLKPKKKDGGLKKLSLKVVKKGLQKNMKIIDKNYNIEK
jgi:hypothetical protein